MKGVGAEKFGMSLETNGNRSFLVGFPRIFTGISRKRPKNLRIKMFGFNFWPLICRPVVYVLGGVHITILGALNGRD